MRQDKTFVIEMQQLSTLETTHCSK